MGLTKGDTIKLVSRQSLTLGGLNCFFPESRGRNPSVKRYLPTEHSTFLQLLAAGKTLLQGLRGFGVGCGKRQANKLDAPLPLQYLRSNRSVSI